MRNDRKWSAIAEIVNSHLRATLYLIDLNSEEGKKLVGAFPECFSDKPCIEPISLSVLLKRHIQDGNDNGFISEKVLYSGDAIPSEIPVIMYHFPLSKITRPEGICYDLILPEGFDTKVRTGDVVELGGSKLFVAGKFKTDCSEIGFIPAELVIMDCVVPKKFR